MDYPIELHYSHEDQAWIAEVYDLPGCLADGKTQATAIKEAATAAKLWIEVAQEEGREIPPPSNPTEASGQLLLRLPKSLHAQLKRRATRDGVSLNQYLVALLAARDALHG